MENLQRRNLGQSDLEKIAYQEGRKRMESNDTKLLQAINAVDKTTAERFARLETKIDESINARFIDNERRISNNELRIEAINENVNTLKTTSLIGKAKWFDDVMKYVVLAGVGYLLYIAGIR